MNYFTAMASPVFEFPYSGYQAHSMPHFDNDINAILANIAPPSGGLGYNQLPSITLQCVPQINTGIGSNAMVYQVPENVPIETILQQFGISTNTLQPSNPFNNYYQSTFQPMEIHLPPSLHRRRRLVCHEVSDSEDENYLRRPSHRHHRRHSTPSPNQPQQPPVALHNMLNKVWQKAERASENMPSSASAPNLNSQWQSMRNSRPPPQNYNINDAWQRMRNTTPPASQDHQNAVSNVWNKADHASELNANRLSNMFNRMRQPSGGFEPPPPPPPQNREAVQNFFAARNLPSGLNQPPPQNREAVQDFFAARNVPSGFNQPPPNREAAQDFFAARNVPYGVNLPPPPPQNQEAIRNFFAARNVPSGFNQPPPNREAVQNFFAARNLPYGMNQPNPAVSNVWNRADYAAHQGPPPMINIPFNQMPPPPTNSPYNRMQQGAPSLFNPPYPNSPMGFPRRGPGGGPAPASFAAILSQAHKQHLPYAGAA